MRIRDLVTGAVIAALTICFSTTVAVAEPSCTAWMDQGDGTSWRECVNDDGSQHCYKISNAKGSIAYEVSCSK